VVFGIEPVVGLAVVVAEDGWDMHGWGDGWWVVMGLGMLLFWALVIVGIVWVMREFGGSRQERDRDDPLDILQRRLARGDISVDEYERSRQALQGPGET
jgi:putative membrane protein